MSRFIFMSALLLALACSNAINEKSTKANGDALENISSIDSLIPAVFKDGHLFDEGPKPSGLRYCINSVSLAFVEK